MFTLLRWFAGRHRLLDPRTQDVRGCLAGLADERLALVRTTRRVGTACTSEPPTDPWISDLSEGAGLTMRQGPHQVAQTGFPPVHMGSLEHSPG